MSEMTGFEAGLFPSACTNWGESESSCKAFTCLAAGWNAMEPYADEVGHGRGVEASRRDLAAAAIRGLPSMSSGGLQR